MIKIFVVQELSMKDQFKNVRWCKNSRGFKNHKFVDFMPKIGGVEFSHDFGFFGTLKNSSLDIVLPRRTLTRHRILRRQNSFLRKTYPYAISLRRRIFFVSQKSSLHSVPDRILWRDEIGPPEFWQRSKFQNSNGHQRVHINDINIYNRCIKCTFV